MKDLLEFQTGQIIDVRTSDKSIKKRANSFGLSTCAVKKRIDTSERVVKKKHRNILRKKPKYLYEPSESYVHS